MSQQAASEAARVRAWIESRRDEMVEVVGALSSVESPSTEPGRVLPAFALFSEALDEVGFRSQLLPGRASDGCLYSRPARRRRGASQLLVGHMDTVWATGTLAGMPVQADDGRLKGPGTYDMKAGLVQALFAVRALRELDLEWAADPVLLVNSDEEVGSRDSTRHIRRLARVASRAFVLEPSLGQQGALKTARKGVGRFRLVVHGRASHAGLDPESGISAILELTHQIQRLFAMNDPARGVTVNVGTIEGGTRANVVAPRSEAVVDVRVPTHADARRVEAAILSLEPVTPGVRLEIAGGIGRPPMEQTPASRALWGQAQAAADALHLELHEARAGGGSDGNTTSQYTPTLDGLGAVGDGAHAAHEFVFIDKLVERSALLALLLRAPLEAM